MGLRNVAMQLLCDAQPFKGSAHHIVMTKVLANFLGRHRVHPDAVPRLQDFIESMEVKMAWKAPKIVEVAVGMEINMYACAARK
jgi:coenzyme PQQ precursor peptide PqqA